MDGKQRYRRVSSSTSGFEFVKKRFDALEAGQCFERFLNGLAGGFGRRIVRDQNGDNGGGRPREANRLNQSNGSIDFHDRVQCFQ